MTLDKLQNIIEDHLYDMEATLWLKVNDESLTIQRELFDVDDGLKLIIVGISILIILGLIILWNQQKIKKMIRDLNKEKRTHSRNQ